MIRKQRKPGCLVSVFWILVLTGFIFVLPPIFMEYTLKWLDHGEISFNHLLIGWWATVALVMMAMITRGLSRQKNKGDGKK